MPKMAKKHVALHHVVLAETYVSGKIYYDMLRIVLLLAFLIPLLTIAQYEDHYITWVGHSTSNIIFEEDNQFKYASSGSLSSLLGKGIYDRNRDTLILKFENYVDSQAIDCSFVNSHKTNSLVGLDSIRLTISVVECRTGEPLAFPYLSIWDTLSNKFNKGLEGKVEGRVTFNLARTSKPGAIIVNAPEYHAKRIFIDPTLNSDLEIEVGLALDFNRYYVEQGEVWRYLILEENPRYLQLLEEDKPDGEARIYMRIKKKWSKEKKFKKMVRFFPYLIHGRSTNC